MKPSTGDGLKPTLAELVALRAIAQRRLPARKGRYNVAGPAQSSARGRGLEYAESREYVAGDDVRHIDWRLTARSGRTHTKLFQAERERLTLIVADTSPALYFGTRVRYKSVQAARAAAVAVWAAVRDGDRVAILRGSRQEAPVPPASGARRCRGTTPRPRQRPLRPWPSPPRWRAGPSGGGRGRCPPRTSSKRARPDRG